MKKGFTLIELLAVIVILAIIALIATPIILGIINDARKESQERSIELYASAAKNAIAKYQLNNISSPTSFDQLDIEYDGDVVCTTQELYADGSIYLADCTVNGDAVEYTYGEQKGISVSKACTIERQDTSKYSVGDVVTCAFEESTEQFYVIENEEDDETPKTVSMLAMYNLNVGDDAYPDGTIGIQNENVFGCKSGYTTYGTVVFSTNPYWSSTVSNYPAYVYNDQADEIYPYVNAYEEYLQENGVISASATLISKEQLEYLNCSVEQNSCSSAPEWVLSTWYWAGFAGSSDSIWIVNEYGPVSPPFNTSDIFGVRPVITIATSDIQ